MYLFGVYIGLNWTNPVWYYSPATWNTFYESLVKCRRSVQFSLWCPTESKKQYPLSHVNKYSFKLADFLDITRKNCPDNLISSFPSSHIIYKYGKLIKEGADCYPLLIYHPELGHVWPSQYSLVCSTSSKKLARKSDFCSIQWLSNFKRTARSACHIWKLNKLNILLFNIQCL